MRNAVLLSILTAAVLVTVASDIQKRLREGIPNPGKTGIVTLSSADPVTVGTGEADLTPFILSDTTQKTLFDLTELAQFPRIPETAPKQWKSSTRKTVNRLSLKVLLIGSKREAVCIVSAELSPLSIAQIQAIRDSLKTVLGLDPRFVLCFSTGLPAYITVRPSDLAQCALQATVMARQDPQPAEMAFFNEERPFLPAVSSQVRVNGLGTLDLPPLCGPPVGKRAYDASGSVNQWHATLSQNAPFYPPGSVLTPEIKQVRLSALAFRSKTRKMIGGLVLSPYVPCIAPASELNGEISADYPGHLCGLMGKKLGGRFLFIRSPGNEILPFFEEFSHSNAHRFGTKLGALLAAEFKNLRWQKAASLRGYFGETTLPLKPLAGTSKPALSLALEKYRRQMETVRDLNLDFDTKREIQDKLLSTRFFLAADSQTIAAGSHPAIKGFRLDGFFFLALPGENHSQTAQAILREAPNSQILIADQLDAPALYLVPKSFFHGVYKAGHSIYTDEAAAELARQAAGFLFNTGELRIQAERHAAR